MVVADDFNGVAAAEVAVIQKPYQEDVLYLILSMASGAQVTVWFPSVDARDSFYKRLIEAMEKA